MISIIPPSFRSRVRLALTRSQAQFLDRQAILIHDHTARVGEFQNNLRNSRVSFERFAGISMFSEEQRIARNETISTRSIWTRKFGKL